MTPANATEIDSMALGRVIAIALLNNLPPKAKAKLQRRMRERQAAAAHATALNAKTGAQA
jgi:hypothetical protein